MPKNNEKFSHSFCYNRILARLISDSEDNKITMVLLETIVSQIVQTPKI